MTLRPELEEILRLAKDARATAEATLGGLSVSQLEWTPGRGRWSAALIADHLVRTNDLVRPKFEAALRDAPPADNAPHPPFKWMERWLINAMSPGTKVRVPVPPAFEPKPPADPKAAVAAFFAAHDALVALISSANERKLAGLKIASPANPLVKFRFVPYLHALMQHERYHLEQVKGLIDEPGFPKA